MSQEFEESGDFFTATNLTSFCTCVRFKSPIYLIYAMCILKGRFFQGSVLAPSFDHGVGDPVEEDILISLQCVICTLFILCIASQFFETLAF